MSYQVIISPEAEQDLADLLGYLTPVAGAKVSKRYVRRLIDYCRSFETFPHRGTALDKVPGLRLVGYRRKATIAFQVKEDIIIIARIWHHGRDFELDNDLSQTL